mgnify:CR=1 FL=1|jgi:phosphoribosylformylglycinamidine synthase
MNFSVLQFPGSNCDQDCVHVFKNVLGHNARLLWHKETSLGDTDAVIIPGGFSYGDYLRGGAIARYSNIMAAVKEFADRGGPVLGICNGFQILCEAGLLPGALIRNRGITFLCEFVWLRTGNPDTPFTCKAPEGTLLRIPIAHEEGSYFADPETLRQMEANGQILWHYCDRHGNTTPESNPNGSLLNIAGICNAQKNVAGLMPHPERAAEEILSSRDGRVILESMIQFLENRKRS